MLAIFLASSLIGMADTLDEALSFYNKGDYDSAIKLVKPLAEQGNAAAQIRVGICFVSKGNYDSAMKLLKPLAEQGNIDAQISLGNCFFKKGDYDSAIKLFKPLAEQGNIDAQISLGVCFVVKGDDDSAIKWLKPLAEQGNTDAQLVLGRCFADKGDYDSAIKLLKPLAEQGNAYAQNWLESCLSLKEAYDTDENRLKNLMDWWKDKAIDSAKLEQILVQHKQYIFNKVYTSGKANSLKFGGIKGDVIEVSVNWTGWVTQGNSIIGIDYSGGEPSYYEISVVKESNSNNINNAMKWFSAGLSIWGGLKGIGIFD